MTNIDRIESKLREFLSMFTRETELNEEDNFSDIGFYNSLFAMQLIMFIEKTFDISIANEDLNIDNFKNIKSIVAFLRINLEKNNSGGLVCENME